MHLLGGHGLRKVGQLGSEVGNAVELKEVGCRGGGSVLLAGRHLSDDVTVGLDNVVQGVVNGGRLLDLHSAISVQHRLAILVRDDTTLLLRLVLLGLGHGGITVRDSHRLGGGRAATSKHTLLDEGLGELGKVLGHDVTTNYCGVVGGRILEFRDHFRDRGTARLDRDGSGRRRRDNSLRNDDGGLLLRKLSRLSLFLASKYN